MKLQNKIAIVTGGARGIGFATALRFAQEGAKIALWDMLEEELKTAQETLSKEGAQVIAVKVDVTRSADVAQAYDQVEAELGPVDIIVNNAGITRDAMLHKMSDEQFDQVIAVNLKGVFNCGREAGKRMREKGSGVILSTSSVVGLYGNIGQTNYAATKAGVIGMTQTWAKELGRKGVRANAVAPGYTMTEMMGTVPQKVLDMLADKTPAGRLGQPHEIAAAFAFLASDDAAYINGHVLSVDGGLTL